LQGHLRDFVAAPIKARVDGHPSAKFRLNAILHLLPGQMVFAHEEHMGCILALPLICSDRHPENVSKLVAADVSPLQSHAKPGKSEPTHVGCYDERMF
jgi:hypothetical protein